MGQMLFRRCLLWFSIIFSIAPGIIQAQPVNIDSIMGIFEKMPNDNIKIDSMLVTLDYFEEFAPEAAKTLAFSLCTLARNLKDAKGEAKGLIIIGYAHTLLNQVDSALYYYNRGQEILERISDKEGLGSLWLRKGVLFDIMEGQNDSASLQAFYNAEQWFRKAEDEDRGIAISLANQGNIHRTMGHYQTAIDLLDEAITINQRLGNQRSLGLNFASMGLLYESLKNYPASEESLLKALEIGLELKDDYLCINAYTYLTNTYAAQQKHEQALEFSLKTLDLEKKQGASPYLLASLLTTARNCLPLDRLPEATQYIKEAEALMSESPNDDAGLEMKYAITKARLLMKRGQHLEAKPFFLKARDLLDQVQPKNQEFILQSLSEYYTETGDFRNALQYRISLQSLTDSLATQQHRQSLNELNARYENVQKEKTILQLENDQKRNQLVQSRQRWTIGGAMAILILMLAWAFTLYRSNQSRKRHNRTLSQKNTLLNQQKKEIEEKSRQNEVLLKEVHHRVKNNLQFVSSLLSLQSINVQDHAVKNAILDSQARVNSMSLIHQRLYRGVNLAAVEMKHYFSALTETLIDAYVEDLEDIDIKLSMDEMELDADFAIPLGLLANELITNSLKHAFPVGHQDRKIDIKLKQTEAECLLEISDNGIGKDLLAKPKDSSSSGFGSQLIQMLTQQLNGTISQSNHQGYTTQIRFPYLQTAI